MRTLLITGAVCLLASCAFAQTDSTSMRSTRTTTTRKTNSTIRKTDTTQTQIRRNSQRSPVRDSTKH